MEKLLSEPSLIEQQMPARATLLGLPKELRDSIYEHLFSGNGLTFLRRSLRGRSEEELGDSRYSTALLVLMTCKQIYAEAFSHAYHLTCFVHPKPLDTETLNILSFRLNAQQTARVQHLAFLSNYGTDAEFINPPPPSLQLTRITICSVDNLHEGHEEWVLMCRIIWLMRNVRALCNMQTLKSLHFLSGHGQDQKFATEWRESVKVAMDALPEFKIGNWDEQKFTTVLTVLPKHGEDSEERQLELKVANISNAGFDLD
jgi:hypothetical protein